MLRTEKIDIYYKNKQIKLLIQMDLPEDSYSEQEEEEELHGVLVMQIRGNKKDLFPVMYEQEFREKVKELLTTLTGDAIIHLPEEVWPEKWDDWEIVV